VDRSTPHLRAPYIDLTMILALLVLAILVRRPWYMLRHPFWLDEAWVVDSVRAPFRSLPSLTSSTPLGWTALLRTVPPVGGEERYRLLPLLFATASVLPAYALGRILFAEGRLGAAVTGLTLAIIPAGLLRHDLKQYTADVFMAVLLFWLSARLEREWSRRHLLTLLLASAAGLLISHTTAFVASSVLVALFLVNIGRGAWNRVRDVVIAGGALLIVSLSIYFGIDRRGINPRLTAFWSKLYVPLGRGPITALDFVLHRGSLLLKGLHLGPWWLALVLVLLGSVSLWRRGYLALALVIPLVAIEMVIASIGRRYPLWDQRTSLFFAAAATLAAAIGVTTVAMALKRHRTVSTLVVVSFLVLLAVGATRTYRKPLPTEDVRGAARFVATHRGPGDSIVVSMEAGYAFAYYWHPDRPLFVPSTVTALTFAVRYAEGSRIVVATSFAGEDIAKAFDAAAGQTATGARIWIVLSHPAKHERALWLESAGAMGHVSEIPAFRGYVYVVDPSTVAG